MPVDLLSLLPFQPGTTGWTAADLDDAEIESLWAQGSYEIVEGVLTTKPPAYFLGGRATQKLVRIVENYLERSGIAADFANEVEIVISPARLARADMALLTREDQERQVTAAKSAGRLDPDRIRILIPPTLIIEPYHRATKRTTAGPRCPGTRSSGCRITGYSTLSRGLWSVTDYLKSNTGSKRADMIMRWSSRRCLGGFRSRLSVCGTRRGTPDF